jgi:hypothetical protein
VLFADAWADSITQAFGHSAGVHAALALHYKEVEALEAQISVPLLHLLRTALPLRLPNGPGGGSSGEGEEGEGEAWRSEAEAEEERGGA